jgi:hypothetical protein
VIPVDGEQTARLELREPASRAVVLDALRRSNTPVQLLGSAGGVSGRVFACLGDSLQLGLDAPVVPGDCTANVELHGVPFLLRGRLQGSPAQPAVPAQGRWARAAALSAVRVYSLDQHRPLSMPTHPSRVRAYLQQRFPRLVPRGEVDFELLAQLLQSSGYSKLRQAECSYGDWQRFSAEYSYDYVYRALDGRVLGHVSSTRLYSKTWLGHQLATLGGHLESGASRASLYALVCCLPKLMGGERAHFLAYFNLQSRWHQLFFEGFVRWVDDVALSLIAEWDCFELAARDPRPSLYGLQVPEAEKFRIELLEEHELGAATALVRRQIPQLLADAMDILPGQLGTTRLNGDPARARVAFGVHSGQGLTGVALCETGPTNASLFNLLNVSQFFVSNSPPDAQLALLCAVQGFYQGRGIERPLLFAPPGSFRATQHPAVCFRERMGVIAHGGAGVIHYENYCRFHMGRLFRRKERIYASTTRTEDTLYG